MTSVVIRVLGPLELQVAGEPIVLRRLEARMLLALAWTPNAWVGHDLLSERIYFDSEPRDTTSWRSHLRRSLGDAAGIIETTRGQGTRLNTAVEGIEVQLDVDEFRALRRSADDSLAGGDYEDALADYRAANDVWRSDTPYVELADDINAYARAAGLREERATCRQALVRLSIDVGDFAGVLPELRLMAEAHPTDQATVAQLMRASAAIGNPTMAGEYYDQLCRLLGDRGELPTAELIELHGRILRDEIGRAAPLPEFEVDLTPLVGRNAEVETAERSLEHARLVTVVGPPGVGKSRLAREVAARQAAHQRVASIQLVSCRDGSDTALQHHLADELGLAHRSGASFVSDLIERLAAEPTLLILDNCEHIIESLIVLLAGVFGRIDSLHVLATSREPLAIPGEELVRVEPLPIGSAAEPGAATTLCAERVRAAGGDQPQSELLEICTLLDGLPLAIELAAPTIASAGVATAIDRFGSDLALSVEARPADPRHRSLASAIGWTYERLHDTERRTLIAAATFHGAVGPEDIAAVSGCSTVEAARSLATVASRSLARPDNAPNTYTLFETIRRYAHREASHTGQGQRYRAKHAAHIANLAGGSENLPRRLLVEAAPAVRWAMTAPVEDGIATVDALRHELYRIDLPSRLAEWLLTVSQGEGRTALVATELWATTAFFQGNYADLHQRAELTLARVRQLDEPHRLPRLQVITAFSFALAGDYAQAGSHASQAERLASDAGDSWSYAWAASIDAYQLRRAQHHDEATERALQALDRFEGLQYPQGKAFPFFTLAMAEYRGRGDADRAVELLAVGIRHAIAGSDGLLEGVGELFRAQVFAERADFDSASRSLLRVLECCLASPQWTLIVSGLEYAAVLLAAHGKPDIARNLIRFAANARWRNKLATRSRAIPHLPTDIAEPLLALPGRPDPKFMTPDSLSATLRNAIDQLATTSFA